MTGPWLKFAAAWRRWREDCATVAALDRLDPRARAELETLVRIRRDDSEFDGKGRGVRRDVLPHVAATGMRAHS